jgi:hypothetical protein
MAGRRMIDAIFNELFERGVSGISGPGHLWRWHGPRPELAKYALPMFGIRLGMCYRCRIENEISRMQFRAVASSTVPGNRRARLLSVYRLCGG